MSDPSLKNEDYDYINDCREAMMNKRTPFANTLLITLVLLLVIGITWAYFAVLDEVTHAEGKVVPPSAVKVIQNLEGGILSQILVHEGEDVKKGQVLLRIDDTRFAASYREQRAQYLALLASVARLHAETEGKNNITFPTALNSRPDIKARENKLFKSRKHVLDDNVAVLQRSLKLATSELNLTIPLVKQGVMSKIELLRLQREVNELKGQVKEKIANFKERAHTELSEQKSKLDAITEALTSQQDRVKRTTIRSPVAGTVKTININTIGGIIQPGMDIMEIVPHEDYLVIEAKVKPKDIAFIKVGQKATVKVTAYDFSIYGGLKGKVSYISADTITDENEKQTYYEVFIRTVKTHLGNDAHPLPIKVGMIANVDILTGRKSVLDYLLKPLLKAKNKALRER